MIDAISVKIKIASFHLKIKPAAPLIKEFKSTNGIPPSSVPAGHIHLQNHGSPKPVKSAANAGSKITNISKKTNRNFLKNFSAGKRRIFFMNGILKSKS